MKKIYIFLLLSLLLIITTSCDKNETTNRDNITNNGEISFNNQTKKIKPKVLTDLFDGEERIWFYCDSYSSSINYDTKINAVFITKNKEIIAGYYNLYFPGAEKEVADGTYKIEENGKPNPFNKPFVLADFEGMNNTEILNKIKSTYIDASKNYTYYYNYSIGTKDRMQTHTVNAYKFPYKIKYSGSLNSNGNNLKKETIILPNIYKSVTGDDISDYNDTIYDNILRDSKSLKPLTIRDKEYVGISSNSSTLITENTFEPFDKIELDGIDGMSEYKENEDYYYYSH